MICVLFLRAHPSYVDLALPLIIRACCTTTYLQPKNKVIWKYATAHLHLRRRHSTRKESSYDFDTNKHDSGKTPNVDAARLVASPRTGSEPAKVHIVTVEGNAEVFPSERLEEGPDRLKLQSKQKDR